MWQLRYKIGGEVVAVNETELREALKHDYQDINKTIKYMLDRPNEWHFGRTAEYRWIN